MCGILGFFSSKSSVKKEYFLDSLSVLKHRGPDNTSFYIDKNIALGHVRLSIQDISSLGSQPMWDKEEKICIIFNGEIYNFKEIKLELFEYDFRSKTDTEVIIYAYKKWGLEKALKKFNGMFAFSIYDKEKNKVFVVRDRVGVKPLVYFYDKNNFYFSSELKGLIGLFDKKPEISMDSLADYFIYRYIPAPKTIYKNISKLLPGHYLELNLENFELKDFEYWNIENKRVNNISEGEITDRVEWLIKDSVKLRTVADVEVATLLSGGVDSSIISSIASELNPRIRAFTINIIPEKYSEANYSKIVTSRKKIDHVIIDVDKNIFINNFKEIVKSYDEPIADSSIVPTYVLCKEVSSKGIKCAISGDGGDELFFGYNWYRIFEKLESFEWLKNIVPCSVFKLLKKSNKFKQFFLLCLSSYERYRRIMYDRLTVEDFNCLFSQKIEKDNYYFYKKVLNKDNIFSSDLGFLDFKTFLLNDILYKVDIASMANSLEVRVPFLDHRIVEFMLSVPFDVLYKDKNLKYVLKEVSKKYIPEENINRRKKGFSAPVVKWLDFDIKNELLNGEMVKRKIVDRNNLVSFLDKKNNSGITWQLYIFDLWLSSNFEN